MTRVLPELREVGPLVGPASGGSSRRRGPSPGRRGRWAVAAAAAVVASAVAALAPALGGAALTTSSGLSSLGGFAAAALSPRLDAAFLRLVGESALTTVAYAVLGTALSLVLGAVGGLLGSRAWWRGSRGARAGRAVTRVLLVVPRGVHEVVWGLVLLSVLGLAPVVAVLAIGIPFGAVTATVFAGILDDADPRPAAAGRAAGASRAAALLYGLLPGAAAELLSYAFYRFECALRSAAVLGLVGAGGLGFQLALSFQSLVFPEIWTLLDALVVLCVAADAWSSAVRRRVGTGVVPTSLVVAALAVPASALWVGLDLAPLADARSWSLAADLLAQSWPPRLGDAGSPGPVMELAGPALATPAMSVLAIAIALAGGCVLAGLASRDPLAPRRRPALPRARFRALLRALPRVVAGVLARGVLVVLRAVPPPVWALLALFVFLPGLLPGAVALGVYTAGVLGRLVAESVENLDPRPGRAVRAQGATGAQAALYAVLPAVVPRVVAYGLYRWEVTIRESVVVGVVGAGGLGLLLQSRLAAFDYGGVLAVLLALVALTMVVDVTSSAIRSSLPGGDRARTGSRC